MMTTLDFSTPHMLRDREEYDAAVAEIRRLLDASPTPDSSEMEKVEFLSVLVEHYDRQHFVLPGGDPTPQQLVQFMLEQKDLSRADLSPVMGGRSRVSEFFAGKRELSTSQIVELRALLGIPADLLISPSAEQTRKRPNKASGSAKGTSKIYAFGRTQHHKKILGTRPETTRIGKSLKPSREAGAKQLGKAIAKSVSKGGAKKR
jgi:HTH-type transcriptional regulator / antitoxin HigA